VNRTQRISSLSPNDSSLTWETSTGPPEHKSIPVSAELTAKVAKLRFSQGNHSTTQGKKDTSQVPTINKRTKTEKGEVQRRILYRQLIVK